MEALYHYFFFFFLFLATLHSMWDLKFPDQGWNPFPLHENHGVLTTSREAPTANIFKKSI